MVGYSILDIFDHIFTHFKIFLKGDKAIRLGSYPSNTIANIVLNKIGEAYGKKSLFEMPEAYFEFD